jgi:thymidylate synthase (FAD)
VNEESERGTRMNVVLEKYTPDPLSTLYVAYRTCYSSLKPESIYKRIHDGRITRETMEDFIHKRFLTGHTSPTEQVVFEFSISGVSRSFSHQFVRTRVGMSP